MASDLELLAGVLDAIEGIPHEKGDVIDQAQERVSKAMRYRELTADDILQALIYQAKKQERKDALRETVRALANGFDNAFSETQIGTEAEDFMRTLYRALEVALDELDG